MQILPISYNNKPYFGTKFKFSKETIKSIERTTGLSYEEMTTLHIDECEKLMIERGKLKKPNKIFEWISDKYKKIGEETGLLKKEYRFFTDID